MFPAGRGRANFRHTGCSQSREGPGVIDKFRDGRDVRARRGPVRRLGRGRGFGSSGRPDTLLDALCDLDRRDLHLIVNNVGSDFTGVGRLLVEGRIRRLTASFPVLPEFYDEYFAGRVEFELVPAGHAGRTAAGRRGRHRRFLHSRPAPAPCCPTARFPLRMRRRRRRRRVPSATRSPRLRWPRARARVRHRGRLRPGQGVPGRPQGEPAVPALRPELQPAGRHGGAAHVRRGPAPGGGGRAAPGRHPPARGVRGRRAPRVGCAAEARR